MRHCIFLFLFLLCCSCPAVAQEQESNNCQDPAAWTDWQERVSQHPEDQELHLLHDLWMGLCIKVEKGEVPLADAISLFEQARHTLIQQRQTEKRAKKSPAPLSGGTGVENGRSRNHAQAGLKKESGERRAECRPPADSPQSMATALPLVSEPAETPLAGTTFCGSLLL